MKHTTTVKLSRSNKQKAEPKINHAERTHALLSASGAGRWLNCTPSAKLEQEYGQKTTSVYAQEGTLAHELAELFIKYDYLKSIDVAEIDDELEYNANLEKIMSNELFDEEMLNVVPIYSGYCVNQFIEAKNANPHATIEIEQKLDLTEYVPESFGTADCIIIGDTTMEVIDLKYGKGVPVYAEHNKQLMLYGLGALRKYDTLYDIKTIKLTIVQPRIDNISSWAISVEDLIKWAVEELAPAAKLAFAGEGELKAGSWCKFCSVKNTCRALYDKQLEIARHEFKDAAILSDEEIADILQRAPQFIEWINSIVEFAQEKATSDGKIWPGFKLVEGISRRKWADEGSVVDAIIERVPSLSEDQLFDMKPKSISQVEKLIGKKAFEASLSDLVVKPQGKPTLVPISDKRPALGIEDAKNDFK